MIDFSNLSLEPSSFSEGVHVVRWVGMNYTENKKGTPALELLFKTETNELYSSSIYVSEKSLPISMRKLFQVMAHTLGEDYAKSIKVASIPELVSKLNPILSKNTKKIKILILEEELEDGRVYTGFKSYDIASSVESMVLDAQLEAKRRRSQSQPVSQPLDDLPFDTKPF